MLGITDLVTFILGTIFIVLLPGPNSLYVLAASSKLGKRSGYRAALGVVAGDTILMILAATGAASLLQANGHLFTIVKYAGAAYLSYLGFSLMWAAFKKWQHAQQTNQSTVHLDDSIRNRHLNKRTFRTALVVSVLNPKAILFFVSFFIQFVDPTYPHPALTFLVLGLIVQFFSIAYLAMLIYGGVALAKQFEQHKRAAAFGTGAVGLVFVAFGIKLADATL